MYYIFFTEWPARLGWYITAQLCTTILEMKVQNPTGVVLRFVTTNTTTISISTTTATNLQQIPQFWMTNIKN
jgi:hypothetical protein